MKQYIFAILAILAISISSCRSDFDFQSNVGNLAFSRDTVYLDTVFYNIGSSTYTLKVYNKTDKNISIPKIQLSNGEASKYRLMVDGMPGKTFENVELLADDSLFVFIEVTADITDVSPTDFLYTDQIEFGSNETDFQRVELVTLVQDAYFIYPQRTLNPDDTYTYEALNLGVDEEGNPVTIRGQFLDTADPVNGNELHFTADKPYVIYGYAAVPPDETLIIDAGARVHFHAESGLIVTNNASLHVQGEPSLTESLEKEVIFEGDRLEPNFSDVPGQWGTIWFTQGSTNNILSNLTVKNATVGLLVTGDDGTSTPTLDLYNVQVYNCSNVGILARTGNILGRNVVVNNCGQAALACSFGGSYDFTHCTFANYWSVPNQYCVVLSDDKINNIPTPLINANFKNCIVYGSANISLNISKEGSDANFNYLFENCLIKFIDNSNQLTSLNEYNFSGPHYSNCIIASNFSQNQPNFKNTENNELIIGENSAARATANTLYSSFPDILNKDRPEIGISTTDMGAYNFIIFD